jgi:2-hydroxy-3-keto-5-methylthiopentenyl-1-phosphate phosphatase
VIARLPAPPYIVLCDFDGTITVQDVTNLIWDAHLPYDWRATLTPLSKAGKLSALEMIAKGYGDVALPAEALLAEVLPRVSLRARWAELVALCEARRWPLEVVSHGLLFYIREILPPDVALTAFEATFDDTAGRWQVTLPAGIALGEGEDFKSHVVAGLRARHAGHAVIYVGDGRLDFPAARRSDFVFAVRDSTLARMCAAEGITCVQFDDFSEVAAALA